MPTGELSAGPIEYTDTGTDGRVLVLLHGLAMDGRLWDGVVGARLAAAFPNARLVEVSDSYTLVPIDQPELLAVALREFADD